VFCLTILAMAIGKLVAKARQQQSAYRLREFDDFCQRQQDRVSDRLQRLAVKAAARQLRDRKARLNAAWESGMADLPCARTPLSRIAGDA
jgi:hypothetical protein